MTRKNLEAFTAEAVRRNPKRGNDHVYGLDLDGVMTLYASDLQDALTEIAHLRAKVAKADALADVMDTPDQSDGKQGRYHYNWHRVDDALSAYRDDPEGEI